MYNNKSIYSPSIAHGLVTNYLNSRMKLNDDILIVEEDKKIQYKLNGKRELRQRIVRGTKNKKTIT